MLRRGVRRRVGPRRVGRDRAVVDDAPAPRVLVLHDLEGLLRAQERARQVGVHHRLPLLDAQVFQEAGGADPGVVEQEIEATERALGLREEGADGLGITHVGGHDQRPGARVARLGRHLLEGVLAPPGQRDVVALSQQREPDRLAYSAPGARHDRDFLVHIDLLMALMVDVADSLPLMPRFLPDGQGSAGTSTIRSTGGAVGRIMGSPGAREERMGRIVYAAAMSHVLYPDYYGQNVGPHGRQMVEALITVVREMGQTLAAADRAALLRRRAPHRARGRRGAVERRRHRHRWAQPLPRALARADRPVRPRLRPADRQVDGSSRPRCARGAHGQRTPRDRLARAAQLAGAARRREPRARTRPLLRRDGPRRPGGARVGRQMSRYETNVVLYRLKKDPAFRDRFRADPRGSLTDVDLTDEERDAFVRWDTRKLNELGGSLHLLISIPGLGGH